MQFQIKVLGSMPRSIRREKIEPCCIEDGNAVGSLIFILLLQHGRELDRVPHGWTSEGGHFVGCSPVLSLLKEHCVRYCPSSPPAVFCCLLCSLQHILETGLWCCHLSHLSPQSNCPHEAVSARACCPSVPLYYRPMGAGDLWGRCRDSQDYSQ